MNFEQPNDSEEQKNTTESESKKENRLFSFEKKIGEYQVSIIVERGEHPMRINIDGDKKTVEVATTPKGIAEAWDLLKSFKEDEGSVEDILSSLDKGVKEKSEEK